MARSTYIFTLRVVDSDVDQMDPDIYDEILAAREPHDADDDAAILRWLGDKVSDAEDHMNELLPEGWYCKIEDGKLRGGDK